MNDVVTCPFCGMEQSLWQGNGGEGVRDSDGRLYCCEGCRAGTGCTCEMPEYPDHIHL